jgi:hypothetical protein
MSGHHEDPGARSGSHESPKEGRRRLACIQDLNRSRAQFGPLPASKQEGESVRPVETVAADLHHHVRAIPLLFAGTQVDMGLATILRRARC